MRLFIAVWPPAEVVAALTAVPRPAMDSVRWTTPDQWHVTLRFLGEVEDVGSVARALGGASLPGAWAVVGPHSEILSPSVLSLPVAGLDALAAVVVDVTDDIGEAPEDRPFRGHLTLARARRAARRGTLRRVPDVELTARWPVEEVTVVASTLGGAGSRYEILDRVRVAGT